MEPSTDTKIDLSEFMDSSAKAMEEKGRLLVNINGEVPPAILAGFLDCNVSLVYQMRQNGRLPPDSGASFKDCIRHHLSYWKTKAASKVNGLQDAATLQKIQLDRAKTEQAWIQIKRDRGELVETKQLALTLEPYFTQLRTQLCSLARKNPEIQEELDKILNDWSGLGIELKKLAQDKLDAFIESEMEKEIDTGTSLEELENSDD